MSRENGTFKRFVPISLWQSLQMRWHSICVDNSSITFSPIFSYIVMIAPSGCNLNRIMATIYITFDDASRAQTTQKYGYDVMNEMWKFLLTHNWKIQGRTTKSKIKSVNKFEWIFLRCVFDANGLTNRFQRFTWQCSSVEAVQAFMKNGGSHLM